MNVLIFRRAHSTAGVFSRLVKPAFFNFSTGLNQMKEVEESGFYDFDEEIENESDDVESQIDSDFFIKEIDMLIVRESQQRNPNFQPISNIQQLIEQVNSNDDFLNRNMYSLMLKNLASLIIGAKGDSMRNLIADPKVIDFICKLKDTIISEGTPVELIDLAWLICKFRQKTYNYSAILKLNQNFNRKIQSLLLENIEKSAYDVRSLIRLGSVISIMKWNKLGLAVSSQINNLFRSQPNQFEKLETYLVIKLFEFISMIVDNGIAANSIARFIVFNPHFNHGAMSMEDLMAIAICIISSPSIERYKTEHYFSRVGRFLTYKLNEKNGPWKDDEIIKGIQLILLLEKTVVNNKINESVLEALMTRIENMAELEPSEIWPYVFDLIYGEFNHLKNNLKLEIYIPKMLKLLSKPLRSDFTAKKVQMSTYRLVTLLLSTNTPKFTEMLLPFIRNAVARQVAENESCIMLQFLPQKEVSDIILSIHQSKSSGFDKNLELFKYLNSTLQLKLEDNISALSEPQQLSNHVLSQVLLTPEILKQIEANAEKSPEFLKTLSPSMLFNLLITIRAQKLYLVNRTYLSVLDLMKSNPSKAFRVHSSSVLMREQTTQVLLDIVERMFPDFQIVWVQTIVNWMNNSIAFRLNMPKNVEKIAWKLNSFLEKWTASNEQLNISYTVFKMADYFVINYLLNYMPFSEANIVVYRYLNLIASKGEPVNYSIIGSLAQFFLPINHNMIAKGFSYNSINPNVANIVFIDPKLAHISPEFNELFENVRRTFTDLMNQGRLADREMESYLKICKNRSEVIKLAKVLLNQKISRHFTYKIWLNLLVLDQRFEKVMSEFAFSVPDITPKTSQELYELATLGVYLLNVDDCNPKTINMIRRSISNSAVQFKLLLKAKPKLLIAFFQKFAIIPNGFSQSDIQPLMNAPGVEFYSEFLMRNSTKVSNIGHFVQQILNSTEEITVNCALNCILIFVQSSKESLANNLASLFKKKISKERLQDFRKYYLVSTYLEVHHPSVVSTFKRFIPEVWITSLGQSKDKNSEIQILSNHLTNSKVPHKEFTHKRRPLNGLVIEDQKILVIQSLARSNELDFSSAALHELGKPLFWKTVIVDLGRFMESDKFQRTHLLREAGIKFPQLN